MIITEPQVPPPTRKELAGYSKYAVPVAAVLTMVLAVRVHELFPQTAVLRPGLLSVLLGAIILASTTKWYRIAEGATLAQTRWQFAYLGWAVLTIPFALFGKLAVETVISLGLGVTIMLAYVVVPPTRRVYHLLSAWFVGWVCVYGLRSISMGSYLENGRLQSIGGYDPNDIAALVALTIPFAVAHLLRARKTVMKVLALGAVLILLVTLFKVGSRGGMIALGVSMFVFLLGFRGGRMVQALMVAAVLAVAGIQFMDDAIAERFSTLFELENDYNVSAETGRLQIWERGFGYALANPVVGVGAGNFSIAEGDWLAAQGRGGKWSASHNAYVQSVAELGFPGVTILLAYLFSLFKLGKRTWRVPSGRRRRYAFHQPELLASLASFATTAMFLSHAYHHALWMLGGLIILAARSARLSERRAMQRSGRPSVASSRRGRPVRRPATLVIPKVGVST